VRVAACCSSNPHRTRGVGFLRHLSCVSRANDRAHTAHLSCMYPVLMSFCDVCVCVCVFCSACCSTCCRFLKIYLCRPTLAWHIDVEDRHSRCERGASNAGTLALRLGQTCAWYIDVEDRHSRCKRGASTVCGTVRKPRVNNRDKE